MTIVTLLVVAALPTGVVASNIRGNCLDAGGARSSFQYSLAARFKQVVLFDMDREYMKKHHQRLKSTCFRNIQLVEGDIKRMPFPTNHFDQVFCISVVEHIADWRSAIHELIRVIKPGGKLTLTVDVVMSKGKNNVDGGGNLDGRDLEELGDLLGFDAPEHHELDTVACLEGKLLKVCCINCDKLIQ